MSALASSRDCLPSHQCDVSDQLSSSPVNSVSKAAVFPDCGAKGPLRLTPDAVHTFAFLPSLPSFAHGTSTSIAFSVRLGTWRTATRLPAASVSLQPVPHTVMKRSAPGVFRPEPSGHVP